MSQNWEERLSSEFNWDVIFGKDSLAQKAIVDFIKSIRQQDKEELIKKVSFGLECFSDGGHRYQDKIAELIKDYYKQ